MRSKLLLTAAVAASAFAVATAANATTNLVQNGGFESSSYGTMSSQFSTGFGGQGVTDWLGGSGLQQWFYGPTSTTTPAANQWSDPNDYFWPSFSPISGNFVAIDGDPKVQGSISQSISGLVVGKTYTLTFDWGAAQLKNRSGDITEQLAVSLGGVTQDTGVLAVPSRSFSGWQSEKMTFTATAATETLSFLSIGSPTGLPPMAVLDNVSIAVPEPATWAMMILGFGAIGFAMRRRRGQMLATA